MADALTRPIPTPGDLAAAAHRRAAAEAPGQRYDRRVWEQAVMAGDLHANARLVALILAHHAGDSGYLPAGNVQDARNLTVEAGLRGRYVRLSLTQLEHDGYIARPSIHGWDEPRPRPVTLTLPPAGVRREPPSTGGAGE
ncbi:hypothetical protein SSP24_06350 [Streptomyces spinoverrucosus]|uniref:Uncharacterized protein n=1 Tax=Streptomyces spinoverrucosus TaxID=284043 RepID=A0A4Y3VAY8_9ACTN|nr:hypothetical protein [Streptomyces spinoverrucosus]GEC02980.1 hypothetical protein SSP24_06350 [Streptomyces spinoverrucosus]GHB39118.1 hypothetical protein GCM10010397_06240 [Streptomyces spinoverrucosus]